MAKIKVKLFGVMSLDSKLQETEIGVNVISDIFDVLNDGIKSSGNEEAKLLSFKDAVVFVNGERCKRKGHRLSDNDEVWLMSPASGG